MTQAGAAKQQVSLLLTLFCTAGMLWAASNRDVADVAITPGRVTWTLNTDAQGWTLTIAGKGIYLEKAYERGETPSLRPVAPDGGEFPDGSYNWELRAAGPSLQGALDQQRRTSASTRRLPSRVRAFERRTNPQPVVSSGSFRIVNGVFAMPVDKKAGRQ